jgi:hypothetical protein
MSATFIIWTTLQASNNARGKQWTLWCCYDKKHMSSPMFLSGVRVARTLCFCVMVCRSLVLSVWSFCLAIELIVSQDWNFSQISRTIVIYLFSYTKYTFVPWRMRLHKKGVSWTWNNIIFHLEAYYFMRMQQGQVLRFLSLIFIFILCYLSYITVWETFFLLSRHFG